MKGLTPEAVAEQMLRGVPGGSLTTVRKALAAALRAHGEAIHAEWREAVRASAHGVTHHAQCPCAPLRALMDLPTA